MADIENRDINPGHDQGRTLADVEREKARQEQQDTAQSFAQNKEQEALGTKPENRGSTSQSAERAPTAAELLAQTNPDEDPVVAQLIKTLEATPEKDRAKLLTNWMNSSDLHPYQVSKALEETARFNRPI